MENMNKCLNVQKYLKSRIFKKKPITLSPSNISQKERSAKQNRVMLSCLLVEDLVHRKVVYISDYFNNTASGQ